MKRIYDGTTAAHVNNHLKAPAKSLAKVPFLHLKENEATIKVVKEKNKEKEKEKKKSNPEFDRNTRSKRQKI